MVETRTTMKQSDSLILPRGDEDEGTEGDRRPRRMHLELRARESHDTDGSLQPMMRTV